MAPSLSASGSIGQVIEYIQDRLYLASYTHAPSDSTPFPYPSSPKRTPHKRSSKIQHGPVPVVADRPQPVYFTIDDTLLYNAFHADFGPLHIGHLYRFAVIFHEILGEPANNDRPVVFWSRADARSRANAACIVACYMVLIQAWPPHLALAPIAQADPPYMPFRDAGYSQADFMLSIQDVVYGVWKAKEEGLCQLKDFNLEEYERFERVDQGDFNWVSPQFLAFASPQSHPVARLSPTSVAFAQLPACIPEIQKAKISQPFRNVLTHFVERDVGLVVRLNSELYCPSYFEALGIQHVDMIFEDGTCPALPIVRKFIKLAHNMIAKNKGIAVHCKAGLGRTGCLIGAYLIYRHGFTANEVIAFMRFMRPGMVVGPQQHWLHLNQGQFREWYLEDQIKAKYVVEKPSTPKAAKSPGKIFSNGQTTTPPPRASAQRSALGEIDGNDVTAAVNHQDENLPAPTPGQPRKYARMDSRNHPYSRSTSGGLGAVSPNKPEPETLTTSTTHRQSITGADSEEEYILQRIASRRSTSKSPNARGKGRSVSYTTTTTTTTRSFDVGDTVGIFEDNEDNLALSVEDRNAIWDELAHEQENLRLSTRSDKNVSNTSRTKTPRSASGMGSMAIAKTRSQRESLRRSNGEDKTRVRKTSGRVGSTGHVPINVKGR